VEYPGYGSNFNTGITSAQLIRSDAIQVVNYLTKELGLLPQDLLLFGRSMGTGVCTFLADYLEGVGGLILFSPFYSITQVAAT